MDKRGKKTPRRPAVSGPFASQGAGRGRRLDKRKAGEAPAPGRPAEVRSITPNRRHGFADGARPYDYSRYESEPATPEYLARLFARRSFAVTSEQLDRFWKLYDLLRRHNASLDLTRIMGLEATALKHFVDSGMILRWFEPAGPVLDIGSGPGFPGLPLAILRPDIRFILAESRAKRVGFLRTAVDELRLGNVSIFPRSVREDSPLGEDCGVPVGDVVTRALERVAATLERVLPFLAPGRQAVFMKGPDCGEEIAEARERFSGIYELSGDIAYALPGTDQGRRLALFRKLPLTAG